MRCLCFSTAATPVRLPIGLTSTKESDLKISFHGADRGVTGSCHLVECAGKRILIDCGLYQGSRELDEENAEPFGFDAASINYVLLTHAHLDHCGRLPLLAKRGFRGEIITTSASVSWCGLSRWMQPTCWRKTCATVRAGPVTTEQPTTQRCRSIQPSMH